MFKNLSRTRISIIWSAVERFSTQLVQFVISIILARLLTPADYGIIALVNVLLIILQTINESGFAAALMQKLDRDKLDYSTTFVFNLLLGVVLYAVLYLWGAPFLADFFKRPELTLYSRLTGLTLIINSLCIVQKARLTINLDYKTQSKATVPAAVLSGVIGIIMAYGGYGVMALVAQFVLNSLFNTIIIWLLLGWGFSIKFSLSRLKPLLSFTYKHTLAKLINSVYNEIAPVFIGKYLNATDLGLYNRAYSFQMLPSSNIVAIMARVSTPLLCEAQNNKDEMKNILKKFIVKTSFFVFPIMVCLGLTAYPLISILLTDKWIGVAPMLQIICPIGILFVINNFNNNIFTALNRPDLYLRLEVIKKIISVALMLFAIKYGIYMLLFSQLLLAVLELFFNSYYTNKFLGFGLCAQLKSTKHIILASAIMGLAIWIIMKPIDNSLLKITAGLVFGSLVYLLYFKCLKLKQFEN